MLLLPDKLGEFYVPLLKTKVEQDFTHLPVLPDKTGKFYVPLFNSKSGTRTAPALLYPDSRPEPAARRAANHSIERERDAHLHPAFASLALSEAFRHEKPPGYEYPNA